MDFYNSPNRNIQPDFQCQPSSREHHRADNHNYRDRIFRNNLHQKHHWKWGGWRNNRWNHLHYYWWHFRFIGFCFTAKPKPHCWRLSSARCFNCSNYTVNNNTSGISRANEYWFKIGDNYDTEITSKIWITAFKRQNG